ncbi:Bug family tripartite tricarboxylate transporter substrate binding protein [Bordetella bronchiseptica]|uniref:Tripartite tricarboxylate transporter family receptor n=2 Tax=Bordetella bronchiseptica TaxID=518 RepID=A0ABR4RAM2_BORBO|nr:tripartite tricarboxylate transporter substrate binding protein [Bordetella bronchiseptica]SHR53902.1 periplasmic solute-binding protein [Mycobacteroides abscessus subsp. abscessus]AWP74096.1 LacI family transcriptional regulator [Bordetella bronchiseptica]AZW20894.1 tripartite tricarboxylate transporter substrate binding protein [Bordetella bronchiseptica]KCV33056.1 tripartite tricarboxylate transporter family receptor [Bordetella bronchiseptica 00-P-2796]KDB96883.1 tripartite tricarboxyla
MNSNRRRMLTAMAGMAGMTAFPFAHGSAGAWPERPIRLILPYAASGPTDVVARRIAARLAERLGQQFIVENKPGAGGNIASEFVAKSAADGYTALYHSSGIAIAPALYSKMGYDPARDLAAVAMPASIPAIIIAGPALPASVATPAQFVQYLRDNPGKLSYGSGGVGNITHLAVELMLQETGTQATHVPYKGTAPAMVDLIGGRVHFMLDALSTALPAIREGRARAIAVTSQQRAAVLPDVPTLAETVIPKFAATTWHGVFVPASTPAAVVARLNAQINLVAQEPELARQFAEQAVELHASTPAAFAAFLGEEIARWGTAAREAGVTPA